jgi:hypothetical protein
MRTEPRLVLERRPPDGELQESVRIAGSVSRLGGFDWSSGMVTDRGFFLFFRQDETGMFHLTVAKLVIFLTRPFYAVERFFFRYGGRRRPDGLLDGQVFFSIRTFHPGFF